jgi:predicted nucleotidyltransferase
MSGDATTLHRITPSQREAVFARIATGLAARPDVAFAYVFGSSLTEPAFHDVDVAVWLQESPADPVDRALELAGELGRALKLPIDVRPLNGAPVSFVFHALRGRLLFARDEERLAGTIEDTVRRYLDQEPLVRRATREAFGS